MLTAFQEAVAVAVANVTGKEGFALAGGAALIVQGLVDRHTRDLDFFTRDAKSVNQVCPAVEEALRSEGMQVLRRVDAPGFVRLEVSRGNEVCEVDLGNDARLQPESRSRFGPVISKEELAADKTLALFGRAAARDFVDVFSLARIFGEERLCEMAVQKDPGFDKRYFADALGAFARLDRNLFEVDDSTYTAIRNWSSDWRARIIDRSVERGTVDIGPDLGEDLGLGR